MPVLCSKGDIILLDNKHDCPFFQKIVLNKGQLVPHSQDMPKHETHGKLSPKVYIPYWPRIRSCSLTTENTQSKIIKYHKHQILCGSALRVWDRGRQILILTFQVSFLFPRQHSDLTHRLCHSFKIPLSTMN